MEFREKPLLTPAEARACIDESGINKPLVRKRGISPRGVRPGDVKSGGKFQRANAIAAGIRSGIVAPLCYPWNTTSASFVE